MSAIGRDPEGARWTNLVPSPEPQDIYREVAKRLVDRVEPYEALGEKDILAWREAIDRTLVKRPTMTTPYGVTPKGIIGQIREAIRVRYPDRFNAPWMAATFLTDRLTEAIGSRRSGGEDHRVAPGSRDDPGQGGEADLVGRAHGIPGDERVPQAGSGSRCGRPT